MTEADPSVYEQTVRIEARPETVWRYWTDAERVCTWWGVRTELDARRGGACVVETGGGAVMRGEFVELVPHERIVFTFGWDPMDGVPAVPPGSSRVEVTLTRDGDDTILVLRHSGLPPELAAQHRAGWGGALELLATRAGEGRT
jgi:uncharacterized protein YndB with AHSA1/START domain